MNGRSLILIIVAIICGILISDVCTLPLWMSLIPVSIALIGFIVSVIRRRKNPFSITTGLNEIIAGSLLFAAGMFSASVNRPSITELEEGVYDITGKVTDYSATNYGDKLLIELHSFQSDKGKRVSLHNVKALVTLKEATDITYGNIITGKAELAPYTKPGNYLKTDYENYLKSKNILATGAFTSGQIKIDKGGFSLDAIAKEARDKCEQTIERTPLENSTKAFLISILLGDKSYLSKSDRIAFSDAGIAHIFAVSGFHVSLVALFLLSLLSLFFFGKRQNRRFIISIPLIWCYILLVGASPATIRAGIMLSFGLTALALQRKNSALKALGWAIILILAFYAPALYDIGFQLSVVCVGTLLLFARPLNFIDHRSRPFLYKIVGIILVTLLSTFSAWIICAFYFHRFSLIFLPLNLFAVPILPFYLAISITYIFAFTLGCNIPFIAHILDKGVNLLKQSIDILISHSLPLSNLHPPVISVILWIAAIAVAGYIFYAIKEKKLFISRLRRWSWAPLLLFCFSLFSFAYSPAKTPIGFILQKNSREASIMYYDEGGEQLITMPLDTPSSTELHGKTLMVVNSEKLSGNALSNLKNADIIMFCNGCKDLPEQLVSLKKSESILVTHPTLHWRHERSIIEAAEKAGISIYSLRREGPLHLFD